MIATIRGNVVPPWKRTFLPWPDLASLAAFLVDDEEGATSMRGYRGLVLKRVQRAQRVDELVVCGPDGRR